MNDIQLLERLNHATQEELESLSGIGPVLAERLIAARPFATVDAVATVKGIKPNLLENWMETSVPLVDLEPASVTEVDATPLETVSDTNPEDEAGAQKGQQAPRPSVKRFIPKIKISGWDNISGYILSAVTAIILTLAILGGINGGLDFASGAEYRSASQDLSKLSENVESMQEDIVGLRSRVDTLDGLKDRTVSIEQEQADLAKALDAATKELAAVQDDLNALDEKVSQQDERTRRFEGFLENLQQSLNELFTTDGSES